MLEIKNLSVEFHTDGGVVHAVRHVDLTMGEGEIRGLVGESGSGKSVTAMTILGLLGTRRARISSGQILVNGRNLLELSPAELAKVRGRQLGLVSQNALSALDPSFTIGSQLMEVIMWHRKLSRSEARKEALEALRTVSMPDPEHKLRAYQHQLSGGQRQRVVIAMALAARPQILLADEPTTALDATVQKQILDLLLQINQEFGTAILMVTHDFGVVAHMCHTVTVMRRGEVLEEGTAKHVLESPTHPYTQALIAAVPRLHAHDQAAAVPRAERRLHVFQEAAL
ncbi:ABC transporter ATP-binding protein [Sediminivirga luteola]|uniref:ABC transporter ATP-binding protein n=1 Tax=Sediminivirga luteola TaxID=1774748 RepID=A0A8J2TVU2_9MICO|nr:ABC transporter ATP-binding protein [Sediminivirga luteola]GGA05099.1 ABC transporter ATP-binding protein [Sediminivirga luteola]